MGKLKRIVALGVGTVLSTVIMAVSPVTAFAGGAECTCETRCTEDHVDPECPLCKIDFHKCEGKDPEVEEKWGPLTPDGNMELVDDYGSLEAGGKQFITVMTKNGNYFYIIIDRDDEGNEKVHFLNMVDESDLLSLMDEDQVDTYIKVTGIGKTEEKEPEEVKPVVTPEPEPEPVKEPEVVEPEKKSNVNGIMAIILILALAAGGGYMYLKSTKDAKKKQNSVDPDEDYFDENDEDYIKGIAEEAAESDDETIDDLPFSDDEDDENE